LRLLRKTKGCGQVLLMKIGSKEFLGFTLYEVLSGDIEDASLRTHV